MGGGDKQWGDSMPIIPPFDKYIGMKIFSEVFMIIKLYINIF